jgi:putative hydrolase of the HAD superfamily
MLEFTQRKTRSGVTSDRPRRVIAFDGDDTLWIDDIDEKRWERDCKRLSIEGLPHPDMADAFRRHLREFGFTQESVQRALIASGREVCDGDIPADWCAQVNCVPQCAEWLTLRCPPKLDRALHRLKTAGYALWIITKGDLIRQAIKLSCFPHLDAFDVVEIVDGKDVATYKRLLAANGCAPSALTMIGDCFREDIVPVVRLGGRAIHVPVGRWVMLRPLGHLLPTRRIRVCRDIGEVPDAIVDGDG